jgi:hypothetical protein
MNVILKPATATTVRAKPATTGAIFGATPAMFKSNFDYQLVRGMMARAYGEGCAFGELYSTARRVVDRDVESWTVEWTGTAERVEAIAHNCLEGGHAVSAREAFLRASLYWRTGLFYLESKDPRQLAIYHHHRSCFRQASALFDPMIAVPATVRRGFARAAAHHRRPPRAKREQFRGVRGRPAPLAHHA